MMNEEFEWITCDGSNEDFNFMCRRLDEDLDRRLGREKRSPYVQFNGTENISEVMLVYNENRPAASGAIRKYDKDTMELKRIFVAPEFQGKGIGTKLVHNLEEWAKTLGCTKVILETGSCLIEACGLYKKLGYKVIPNYGPYENMADSLCMEKDLYASA